MKRKGIKGILAIVLVFVMSFGFGVTSFADDNMDKLNGAIGFEIKLENGVTVNITDFHTTVRNWLDNHKYKFSDSDADNAVKKIEDAKNIIIGNSKAKTAEEFYNEFYDDEEFQKKALKAINGAAKVVHCYIGIKDRNVFVEEYNDGSDDEDTPQEIKINDRLNAAIDNVVLNDGTIIDLTGTDCRNYARRWFQYNTEYYSESDVDAALIEIEKVKDIIKNSGVKSVDDLHNEFISNKKFAKQINDALVTTARTLNNNDFLGLYPDGRRHTVQDDYEDDEEDEDTDNEPVETPTPITAVTSPAPTTQVTSPAPVTSATKPDSAAANSSEPVIKVTGYNFIFIALAVGAFVLLVAGCVIIARRKKLFS